MDSVTNGIGNDLIRRLACGTISHPSANVIIHYLFRKEVVGIGQLASADRIGADLYAMSRRHTHQRRSPLLLSIIDITPTPSNLYEDVPSVTV